MKLQAKIISTVIVITLTVNITFQYNYIRLQSRQLLQNLQNKMIKTNELVSRINAGPIFYYDTQLLETNLQSFLDDPEIKSIYLLETNGEIELFYDKDEITNKNLLELSTPIFYNEQKIGTVVINYTKSVVETKLKQVIKYVLYTLIATTLIISIILLLIIRQIIMPIKELTLISSEISSGNLDKNIIIKSSDEIGILSMSFMKMRDSIKEKIQSLYIENEERKKVEIELRKKSEELANANRELTDHRNHLEDLVDKRTSELQESIQRLELTKDQLVESEKMASLGDLVAGVAHEINTPIGIGVTAASHLDSETKHFAINYSEGKLSKVMFESYIEMARESSSMILSNLLRAANLIQSFKRVAVDQSSEEKRSFNLKEYINEIILSIHSKFKHTNYTVLVEGADDIIMDSFPGALSQIITNLIINSLQHGFEGHNSGLIKIDISESNKGAIIDYTDTGVGISDDIQRRIFDPFFTTKRGQGGSGLGMNIVYNLVTQTLKGNIVCKNKDVTGARFEIILPINI